MKSVAELRQGESGIIAKFADQLAAAHLMGLGCVPGNRIYLIRSAPMGGPLYVRINNSQLAIRREEAKNLLLEDHE